MIKKGSKFTFFLILFALLILASLSAQNTGVYWGIFEEGLYNDNGRLNEITRDYGKQPGIVMWYQDWSMDFPAQTCERLYNQGIMPHIVWEAWFFGQDNIKHADILSGKWDAYITKFAKAAAAYGNPVMLRWGHEMNGDWYPWSGAKNGNSAESYVRTYRYIHDIFTKNGADNVIWVWTPNNDSAPNIDWNRPEKYYPGDSYVDWVGFDAYNWGKSQSWSHWTSVDEIFSSTYDMLQKNYPGKPVLVGEFGCSSSGGNKAAWISDFFSKVKTKYPNIKGWIWFNVNKETDWRFSSDAKAEQAFKTGLTDSIVKSGDSRLFTLHKNYKPAVNPEDSGSGSKKTAKAFYSSKELSLSSPEWAGMEPIVLDYYDQAIQEGMNLSSRKDIRGTMKIAWNENCIMLLLDFDDDVPFQNKMYRQDIWNGDALEICLGLNTKADLKRASFGSGDFQIGVSLRSTPQVWCWTTSKVLMKTTKTELVQEKDGGILMVIIPWKDLGYNYSPKKGDKLGFTFALDDSDESPTREIQVIWEGNGSFYKNPSVWGTLILE